MRGGFKSNTCLRAAACDRGVLCMRLILAGVSPANVDKGATPNLAGAGHGDLQ